MTNEHKIPSCVMDALRSMGYENPDTSMASMALAWWAWYTASAEWYDHTEVRDGTQYKLRRQSLHPARRVCREWASAILDDDGTKIGTDDEGATELLEEWAGSTRFIPTAQRCLERAFGVGTGALALWFDVREDGEVDIRARRYDVRTILPLTWDDDGISECAFVTDSYIDGQKVHQLQVHRLDGATYHVITRMFDAKDGHEVRSDSIIEDFNAQVDIPTFAIVRPALDNICAEGTYMGQSVFADAVDAIKAVDNAFDSMQREVSVTKAKIFASADMFDMAQNEDGTYRAVPMDPDDIYVVKLDTVSADAMYEVFSPTIRTAQLADALDVALSELGDLTGFGQNYFRMSKDGGMKTAREVTSDNSAFARNIKKHENELRPQLEGLLACVLACQRQLNGWPVPDDCSVSVDFDDSVITDTDAEKATMRAEIAEGIVPKWMYLERFFAMSEEDARATIAEMGPEALDFGA